MAVDRRGLADPYARRAKAEGFAARSAYKLLEMQRRRRLLQRGDAALDLGCAPGAWLQAAARFVLPGGALVGLDLKPVARHLLPAATVALQGDVFDTHPQQLLEALQQLAPKPRFDAVLSDMAPDTSDSPQADHHASIRLAERAVEIALEVLAPQGVCVVKFFEGEAAPAFVQAARRRFDKVALCKPRASRARSREMYLLAHGPKPPAAASDDGAQHDH